MSNTTAVKTYDSRESVDAALQDGQSVCATVLSDGTPVYFTVAFDATEDEVRDTAFQVREQRLLTDSERVLIELASMMNRRTDAGD